MLEFINQNIIDVVWNQKNKITVSHYTEASQKIKDNMSIDINKHFTLFNEPLIWTIDSPSNEYLQIDFNENISFEDIQYDFTAEILPNIRCLYSYDGNNWNDFSYISYTVPTSITGTTYDILHSCEGKIIKICGDKSYFIYDPITKKIDIIENGYSTIKLYLDNFYNNTYPSVDVTNVYRYKDKLNQNLSIYDNLRFRYMKLVLTGTSSFVMNELLIYAKVSVNLESISDINIFNDNFFKPKYFEDYDFIPSITKSFFEMLSYTNMA